MSRTLGEEFVVLDERSGQAHALSGLAARVWAATDPESAVAWPEDAAVDDAVEQLLELGLLELVAARGISRRRLLRDGGAIAAVVGIASIALPTAAAAASARVNQTYTSPGTFSYTVPAGVTYLNFVVDGAGGGDDVGKGGAGTSITGRIPVTAGQVITINVGAGGVGGGILGLLVGGSGGAGYAAGGAGGASVGIGIPGSGGGGASSIALAGTTEVVAGGGGGGGGGGGTGGNASTTNSGSATANPGGGGNSAVIIGNGGGGGGGGAGASGGAGGTSGGAGGGGGSYWASSGLTGPTGSGSPAASQLSNGATSNASGGNGSVTLSYP
ncbi:hypothetical protein [Jatrophihabitans sp.]|uniref:hypothetical protein n=1 Tax=Jatrophihabitans sp. TaxID=1932789 RepID=UPI0030C77C9A